MKYNITAITALVTVLLIGGVAPTSAQTNDGYYIEAEAGAQLLFAPNGNDLSFGKRITPSFAIGAGKWFLPYLGVKVQFGGYSLNALSDHTGEFLANGLLSSVDPAQEFNRVFPDGSYRRNLRYLNSSVTIQTSVLNLLYGYSPDRKWDIVPSVGVGVMSLFAYKGVPAKSSVSLQLSLMGKWHFSPVLDLNVAVTTAAMSDRFDSRVNNLRMAWNPALTVGATYYFSTGAFVKSAAKAPLSFLTTSQPPKPKKRVVEVREVVHVQPSASAPTTQPVVVERIEVQKQVYAKPIALAAISFELGSHEVAESSMLQLQNVVNYLNENAHATLRLDAYSDSESGTERKNLLLSSARAASVCEVLVTQFAVNRDRISLRPLGATVQPYDKSQWNRVVVIMAIEGEK